MPQTTPSQPLTCPYPCESRFINNQPLSDDRAKRSIGRSGRWRLLLGATVGLTLCLPANASATDTAQGSVAREQALPRKVVLGTIVSGYEIFALPLEKRMDEMDSIVGNMSGQAAALKPAKGLDLAVLPEFFLSRPGESLRTKSVRLDEIMPRIAACAQRNHTNLVVPALIDETGQTTRYSNAAILVDRNGKLTGIYRKAHPSAPIGSNSLEGGTMPGAAFPVFDCDFGRVAIQICFDMMYGDGWKTIAEHGAELVVFPSASPATARPSRFALQYGYYIVSAAPRDHSAVYNPLGLVEAEARERGEVLVHEIDLSYAIIHWDDRLEEGAAFDRKYGARAGYHYYRGEDSGIFWSNDPKESIGSMFASLKLASEASEVERVRQLQDKARGRAAR